MNDFSFDAVVVGARAAGASTAMLLSRAGMRVLIVDQSALGSDTLSTHALMRGAVLQLARWGLLGDIVAAGTPAIRSTIFHYTHADVALAVKPSACVDALYAPRRTLLDPLLVGAACKAGATARFGMTVVDVERDRHDRVVGVVVRDDRGGTRTVRSDIVIGADGRRSTLARRVGAPLTHAVDATSAFVYGYWSDLDVDGYEWAYRSGVAAGFIPTNDGRTCVFASGTPTRVGRGGRHVLEEIVAEASPDMSGRLYAATAPAGVRTFTGQPGYLRRPWGPGWALVGDSGSWKDPISAHGLTDALRDAELLARAIIAGGSDRDGGEYEAVRDRLSVPVLTAASEIAAYRWDDARVIELLFEINAAMADELDVITAFDTGESRGVRDGTRVGV